MAAVDWTAADTITASKLLAMEVGHLVIPSFSTTVSTTTAETEFAEFMIPANTAEAGMVWRLKAWGYWGVTGTPTLNLRMRFGPNATASANTSWAQTGALTAQSGVSNRLWTAEQILLCEAAGSSGSFSGPLHVKTAGILAGTAPFINDAAELTTVLDGTTSSTIDSTANTYLSLTATWSASSASNAFVCKGFIAEKLTG